MTESDGYLRDFLKLCVGMIRQGAKSDRTLPYYLGPMDLVLREGETFTPAPYDAERWRFEGTPRNCFGDALDLASYSGGALTYVEGYASSELLPGVHHAWTVTEDGTVVDPTWAANGHHGEAYLGIRFPMEVVLDVLAEKETYGLLDHEPLWTKPIGESLTRKEDDGR